MPEHSTDALFLFTFVFKQALNVAGVAAEWGFLTTFAAPWCPGLKVWAPSFNTPGIGLV